MENPIKMDDLVVPLFLETPNLEGVYTFQVVQDFWTISRYPSERLESQTAFQRTSLFQGPFFLGVSIWYMSRVYPYEQSTVTLW